MASWADNYTNYGGGELHVAPSSVFYGFTEAQCGMGRGFRFHSRSAATLLAEVGPQFRLLMRPGCSLTATWWARTIGAELGCLQPNRDADWESSVIEGAANGALAVVGVWVFAFVGIAAVALLGLLLQ